MGKALYRSYRARSFKDVIGQNHITKTLTNSLKSGRHNHAYLLTGPRGVGKTSVARILAHEINKLPYSNEQLPIDIVEIDAASNRRIDEIRDIKEKSAIAPVQAKYKVYIVDEVHMLTKEAFNALLKTLEEPPDHVVFILATTEFHKLPETIVSRCIHFPFKPINKQDLNAHLNTISKAEGIKITPEAIELIAEHGKGSFRDSISLLDQIRSYGSEITVNDVRHSLGQAPDELIAKIVDAAFDSRLNDVVELLDNLYEFGADPIVASQQILDYVRAQILKNQQGLAKDEAIQLMKKLLDIPNSMNPKRKLELVLLGLAIDRAVNNKVEQAPLPRKKGEEISKAHQNDDIWGKVLEQLKSSNRTLYGIIRMAEHEINEDSIALKFKFPFHYKQVSQEKNISTLKQLISSATNKDYDLVVEKSGSSETKETEQNNKKISEHKNIRNIFGTGEVLES